MIRSAAIDRLSSTLSDLCRSHSFGANPDQQNKRKKAPPRKNRNRAE